MAKKVMIIDDASSMRQVVGLTLKAEDYDIIEAVDGEDALEKCVSEDIDMFICDVNMPNMDGITFLQKIREGEKNRYTPFIMLTTEIGEDMKQRGKELGANAWIVKPFKPEQLVDAVKKLMK